MYNVCVQNERFTKIMFLLDRVQNNSSNWNSQVKNTLESLDMESTYTNFTPCNLPYTLYTIHVPVEETLYMYVLILNRIAPKYSGVHVPKLQTHTLFIFFF